MCYLSDHMVQPTLCSQLYSQFILLISLAEVEQGCLGNNETGFSYQKKHGFSTSILRMSDTSNFCLNGTEAKDLFCRILAIISEIHQTILCNSRILSFHPNSCLYSSISFFRITSWHCFRNKRLFGALLSVSPSFKLFSLPVLPFLSC